LGARRISQPFLAMSFLFWHHIADCFEQPEASYFLPGHHFKPIGKCHVLKMEIMHAGVTFLRDVVTTVNVWQASTAFINHTRAPIIFHDGLPGNCFFS